MGCVIAKCVCKNAYQDEKYGAGLRVINMCGGKNPDGGKCTVCNGKVGATPVKEKAKK